MSSDTITSILSFGNLILASVNVIIGFSLFVYILTHNFRSPVARAFCALMAFVTAVYLVDVSITEVDSMRAANIWLRLQWVGIAFVPAAYFHFSDALLRTTGSVSRWRQVGIYVGYVVGLAALGMAAFGNEIVSGVNRTNYMYHLVPGPYFGLFTIYYIGISLGGWLGISRARGRCLTSTSRRRMSYLMLAFAAPSVGAFPYLLIPAMARQLSPTFISVLTLVGNVGIALMTIVIGYIVAYQGVLLPDRVVKHRLIHYLLRGPLVAILVIVIMLTIPRVEHIWGLPRDTMLIVTIAGSVVIFQVLINMAKPAIDRLIYRRDRKEIAWIQQIDQHLLTTADLEQVLENTVIALCDFLRTPSGFIVTMQGATLSIRVFCGPRETATAFLSGTSLPGILDDLSASRQDEFIANQDFVLADGHWVLPLRSRSDEAMLGILGIHATSSTPRFSDEELEDTYGLVQRAELVLGDMRLQQQVFAILQGLGTELDRIQEWRSSPLFAGSSALQHLDVNPIHLPSFDQVVKDALGHFWGGPKLSQSPLRRLQIVRDRLGVNDNVPAKAVRAALQEGIARLKPNGTRSMTSNEWVVYNILDLKFVQGERIRDITRHLAMSESDFYRKQRIAIEQVAEVLAEMERAHHANSGPKAGV